jgi:hypothetical protein
MKTVQLAIHDSEYARSIRKLLLRDGMHDVYLVDRPNLHLDGVVVIDEIVFQNLAEVDWDMGRFVIVTGKGSDQLVRMFEAGIRHVVFEGDSPYIIQLAIIAAELRLPRVSGPPTRAVSGPKNARTEL